MRKSGIKRRLQENGSEIMEDDEDSRNSHGVVAVNVPAGKEKDSEFQPSKNSKLTNLDEEVLVNGIVKDPTKTDISQAQAIEQTHYIIVPSYASLPEFFNGLNKSKTPEVYVYYRNFIVDTYRLNPFEYLSATACRRNLSGDVCAILRVHQFLEQWGLINYQVASESRPTPVVPPSTAHFMVLADTPMGIQPLVRHGNIIKKEEVTETSTEKNNKESDEAEVDENIPLHRRPKTFVSSLKTDQYSKAIANMKAKGALPGKEWSDQETLLLLEGLELYRDDWNKVSDHVSTRSQYECILKFLQLPIKDSFLDDAKDFDTVLNNDNGPLPFSQAGNPVMSTVAFLASMVDPRVSQAAAKAALEQYSKVKDELPPVVQEAHKRNVAQHYADTGKLNATVGLEAIIPGSETKDSEAMETGENDSVNELAKEAKKLSDETISTAAAAALGAAAAKSKQLAVVEERKMKSLVGQIVELQIKKLDCKMKCFEELENIIDKERELLELQQTQLLIERQQFHADQMRYLDSRARMDAQQQLVTEGKLPSQLPPGFEVSGPPPPTQTIIASPSTTISKPEVETSIKSESSSENTPAQVQRQVPPPVQQPMQNQMQPQQMPQQQQLPPPPQQQQQQQIPPPQSHQPPVGPPQQMMQQPASYPPPQQPGQYPPMQQQYPPQHASQPPYQHGYPPQQTYGGQPQAHYQQPQQPGYYNTQPAPPRQPYPQQYPPMQSYPGQPQQGYPPQQNVRQQYAPPPPQNQMWGAGPPMG
ncbi:SANT/Myb domain and SWIRM domain and Homeodomain-like and Winged helix-turn-helix DNA-binding domain and SANT domain-containing protein [Strongyloides ratti]|uniref:SANT/Myb domain and SWIRM domain and Homeodomain-like and Winged helix-turn-helix DNA-binding domain and SANT domain-containing protein n=1 Tax=Strongyloides ratti TaxID=34506 RepID=A0A090MS33_STRRB|nr:SANT/Myb domain and SWIRM domain and Homeodomain-like and Winged helix-turn-helix DNA-binding domain and SANT domain-containing protein [Strongyloides ratti]CEF61063.1 SANT/Myb domain and SWIRM domain and Homeodomain-like and Winged helix-turn-helix DNA-binding domain and SANT domain-containing protein [Strongyloides ratti]